MNALHHDAARLSLRAMLGLALFAAVASLHAEPTRVSAADHKAQGPEIALGPDGSVNMVWIDEDPLAGKRDDGGHGHSHMSSTNLYFARSTNDGASFGKPVRINAREGDVWGFVVSKPRIAVGRNGTIHVFYPANEINPAHGKPHAVAMYSRSTDGGRSFSAPRRLNTMPTSDASHLVHGGLAHAHVFGTLAVDGAGGVYALWIDTRDMAKEGDSGKVFMAVSRDDGRSFEKDREIFPADVCPCCQLTAAVDREGRLYVGSRQVDGRYRDGTVAISRDGGRSFSTRVRLSPNRWEIEGCPLKPIAVAAEGQSIYAAYYSGGENPQGVYFVRSTDAGKRWSTPMQVHPAASVADAPVLTLAGDTLHLFWHAKVGAERRVYTRASRDGGASFGPVTELPAQAGAAQLPVVAARADGSVQVAWQQGTEVRSMRWPAAPAALAASGARASR